MAYSEPATVIPYAIRWDYTYDANGLRTHKSSCAVSYDYIYNGSSLTQLTVTEALDGSTTVMDFSYDASGTPMAVTYNGTAYYYVTNLQGDVVAILNSSGSTVVTYTYDAWGQPLSTTGSMAATLGEHNPLRYRGYVYDQETELYYLQSRYYDPQVGRFINADSLVTTGNGMASSNMFAYCLNNPVNGCDPCGTCFHRLDFWNDCERCAGKTWAEKLNVVAADIYDYATDVYDAHMMQNEWQRQVDQNSFSAMRDSAAAVWDAYVHSNELQAQAQYDRDMTMKQIITTDLESWETDPRRAGDFVANSASGVTGYITYAALASGASIPVAGQWIMAGVGIACFTWSVMRYYDIV